MPPPGRRPPRRASVISAEPLTPGMVRVVLGGEGLEGFHADEFTDHYVKLQLPAPGADYDSGFNREEIQATRPRELWPKTRTYTVSNWDETAGRLTIDFVVHGDSGVAGPWAAGAQPGDVLQLGGPGGAYTPSPDADWHLLVGDASVIPAISAALLRIAPGVPVFAVIEIDGAAEEQPLHSSGDLHLSWVLRSRPPGEEPELAMTAVKALDLPVGRGKAFVHGEASSVRAVRRHLLVDRRLPAEDLSASGYWKLHRDEEGWREDKGEWHRLAAADVEPVA
jgi:NADPH-dependent ferric siderophore reductase